MGPTDVTRKIDQAIEWGLGVVMFFLPISMPVVSVALICSVALWCGKLLLTRQVRWRRTPLDLPVCVFVLCGIVSILWGSPDKFFSLYNFGYLMGHYILTYCLITQNLTSYEQVKKLFRLLFLSASVTAAYGVYQYLYGGDISQYRWVDGDQFPDLRVRLYSTMENPNIYAGFLVIVIALAVGMLLTITERRKRLRYAVMICGLSVCLTLTYSRGAWISFLGTLALLGVIRNTRLLWLLIIGPLLAIWINPTLLERLTSIVNPTDTSSTLRLALWESSLAMLLEHPLTGIGWGAYWLVYPAYDFFINDGQTTIYHAHNMFLNIGAELGFPGLLSFIWLLISVMRLAVAAHRSCRNPGLCGAALGLVTAFTALIINGLTDHVLFNIQMSILLWALMAFTVVIHFAAPRNIPLQADEKRQG
ncbi:MAG TPA: O-antigen ligase family protein [Negativicutes bacterium]|nr:O-antigen ligase family protein [Negativicutes bacterium]